MTKLILFFTSLFFSIGVLFAQNEAALTLRVDKAALEAFYRTSNMQKPQKS